MQWQNIDQKLVLIEQLLCGIVQYVLTYIAAFSGAHLSEYISNCVVMVAVLILPLLQLN